jgi:hypothetical protein
VNEWFEIMDFLYAFNAKISFYISNYQNISDTNKTLLSRIDSMGHEIGFHGTHPVNYNDYILTHTIEEYIQFEIEEGLDAMIQDGFDIRHFAYPYGPSCEALDSILTDYFVSIRKVCHISDRTELKRLKKIYYDFPIKEKIIYGAGIDNYYNISLEEIYQALDKARSKEKVLFLYCHKLCNMEADWNIPIQKLKSIVIYCYENNIPMMTLSEAYLIQ